MNILVFNCGSSSLKYRIIRMPDETELAGGEAQRIGPKTKEPSRILHRESGQEECVVTEMKDHHEAFEKILTLLNSKKNLTPHAMGHRVVHGGQIFGDHVIIDDSVIDNLVSIQDLARIHNPPATNLIKACRKISPGIPQVAVFDTAFHSSIPEYAYTYALPERERKALGVRKYGFHGTSHAFVAEVAAGMVGKKKEELNAVSCHLGSGGASLCAIRNGKSVDNTMGFSPLQGLVMSTRCGDLDPSVTLRLLSENSWDPEAVEKLLNSKSGVLGMSGVSADIRDVLKNSGEEGDSHVAAQVYLWRLRKYLGSYLAVVGDADCIIFTDTIGESVPEVRALVCGGLEIFGLKLDPLKNASSRKDAFEISEDGSPVKILVIPTNEELAIAKKTFEIISQKN